MKYNIVLAARDTDRQADAVEQCLRRDYWCNLDRCNSFPVLQEHLEKREDRNTALVVLVDDIAGLDPWPGRAQRQVDALSALNLARHVAVIHRRPHPLSFDEPYICVLPADDEERLLAELNEVLKAWKFKRLPPLPGLDEAGSDPELYEVIRWLNADGNFAAGLADLRVLVRNLWGDAAGQAHLASLSPGLSGAQVLRVDLRPNPAGKPSASYVLKVVPRSRVEDLRHEVLHWDEIHRALDKKFKSHLAGLKKADGPHDDISDRLVKSGPLYAIAFDFLGVDGKRFHSLEAVYLRHDPAGECPARTMIVQTLELLEEVWYARHGRRARQALWSWQDQPLQPPLTFPPYRLTHRQQAGVRRALARLGAGPGPRLLPRWSSDSQRVAGWLDPGPGNGHVLAVERDVVVSPVHGDLNGGNVLRWDDEDQPFLIDFANYQSAGHTLQDFAHLETEVKFALMDREPCSPVPALDHCPRQLALWLEVEPHALLGNWERAEEVLAQPGRHSAGVRRAVELVRVIREQAKAVYPRARKEPGGSGDFEIEYRAALLYHTLRCIGYESLSPMKRLLAVRSAALLLDSVGH